jgi:membrane-associated phospholipid phosphatase
VSTLIVVVAQYLLFALVAVAAIVWLVLERAARVRMAAEGLAGLALVGVGIWLAAHLHSDPRPFLTDPASRPLLAHAADNGFPSDHAAAAGLLTALVFRYRRALGVLVGGGAVLIAWARVAAHVHHAQDVVAGLALGLAAGALAVWAVGLLAGLLARRGALKPTVRGARRP